MPKAPLDTSSASSHGLLRLTDTSSNGIALRQYRTIASASLSRLFAPLPQFRKWEIHTVFLHFRNFELEQKPYLRLLAELCGAALVQIQCHFEHIHAADTFCLFIVYSSNLVFILCMRKAFPMHKIISLQNVVCISAWKV